MQVHLKRSAGLARCIAVAMFALGAVPAAAAADCPQSPTSMVFAAWGDTSQYFLAPGADFESATTSWTGGSPTLGNDPFYLAGSGDRKSLLIASGKTATSPSFCADATHPDFRFVAQPLDPRSPSWLEVSVRFRDRSGAMRTFLVGAMAGGRSWTASPRMRLMRDLSLLTSGTTTANVVFRAVGGDWAIDDVFIDPYRR